MDKIEIVTLRLVIKNIDLENTQDMFEYRTHPDIVKYQSFKPTTMNDVFEYIKSNETEFNKENTWFQLGVFFQKKMIGDLGVHFIGPENKQCEIGYTISKEFQKRGFGKEAVTYLVSYLFSTLKKHRIIASLDPENIASKALLESIGFRNEGLFLKSIFNNGVWEDDLIYAVLKKEWKSEIFGQ